MGLINNRTCLVPLAALCHEHGKNTRLSLLPMCTPVTLRSSAQHAQEVAVLYLLEAIVNAPSNFLTFDSSVWPDEIYKFVTPVPWLPESSFYL